MRPKSAGASPYTRRYSPDMQARNPDNAPGMRYRLERRVAARGWRHIGSAPSLYRAKLSAIAHGGEIRAVELRTRIVVGRWREGIAVDE
jgi:hypothetical protein